MSSETVSAVTRDRRWRDGDDIRRHAAHGDRRLGRHDPQTPPPGGHGNDSRWSQDAELSAWLMRSRLNPFGLPPAAPDAAMLEAAQRSSACAAPALATRERLLADVDGR